MYISITRVGQYQESLELLKKAEAYAGRQEHLNITTYNNLACLYRKLNRPKCALTFLEKALTMEYKHLNSMPTDGDFEARLLRESPADTHLNLCAVLSLIGRHEVAHLHALKALTFLQAELFERIAAGPQSDLKPLADRCAVLCIAYHNLAAELEFLKQVRGMGLMIDG